MNFSVRGAKKKKKKSDVELSMEGSSTDGIESEQKKEKRKRI